MSRYASSLLQGLEAYVPGEQPRDRKYIKLNTNESPWPPSPAVEEAVVSEAKALRLYPDPENTALREALASQLHLTKEEITFGNGSDDLLNFAFMAFCDEAHPAVFPDISYGFYPVFAAVNRVPFREIPLRKSPALFSWPIPMLRQVCSIP